jgi:hypothetical protein
MTNLHPIFAECCAGEDSRYAIREPWVAGGFRYATDGRIVIRQKTGDPDTPRGDRGPWPPAHSLHWDAALYSPDAVPVPQVEVQMVPCDECAGKGELEWKRKDRWCETLRKMLPCENCGGTGEVPNDTATVNVGDVKMLVRLAAILCRHGAKAWPSKENRYGRPLRFAVDGGAGGEIEGLVMPSGRAEEIEQETKR